MTERRNSGEMADGEGSGLSARNLETIVDMVVAKLQGAAREAPPPGPWQERLRRQKVRAPETKL